MKRIPEKMLLIENMYIFIKNSKRAMKLSSFIHSAFSLVFFLLLTTVNTFQEGS